MKKRGLFDVPEGTVTRRPVLVLAIFTLRFPNSEFLTLRGPSGYFHAEGLEFTG